MQSGFGLYETKWKINVTHNRMAYNLYGTISHESLKSTDELIHSKVWVFTIILCNYSPPSQYFDPLQNK